MQDWKLEDQVWSNSGRCSTRNEGTKCVNRKMQNQKMRDRILH